MKTARWLAAALILAVVWVAAARAAEVLEKFPNGNVRLRYHTGADGLKQGAYVEYHENGKVKVRAAYKADKLNGPYLGNWESGLPRVKANYQDGILHGAYEEADDKGRLLKEQIYRQGRVLYPRGLRIIRETLDAIERPPAASSGPKPTGPSGVKGVPPDALSDANNVAALRRLNAYRYLAGAPHDVTLGAEFCDLARAAADICARIGRLDHHPENPGMPEDEYRKALNGTTHANLHVGGGTRGSVDSFMFDSDPRNIDRLGHRRWCLNPEMLAAGFGESGRFSAMYAHDRSRRDVPDFDTVALPCPGYMPLSYFSAAHAWNVSLNPRKFAPPDKSTVKVAVYPLMPVPPGQVPDPAQRGGALELDYFNVDRIPYGIPNSIIWRPKGASFAPGARYWVEITGLKKTDGSTASVEYIVEFAKL